MINEVIIVEGRDDESAVKRALDAEVIKTNGFGIREETYQRIETAYQKKGIVIFTDPDYAGEIIRKKLTERFPAAKHAYLARDKAIKNNNIGIENASNKDIIEALEKAHAIQHKAREEFTRQDMLDNHMAGHENATQNRAKLGDLLGIGYGNATTFLKRLNHYDISREAFEKAVSSILTKKIEE